MKSMFVALILTVVACLFTAADALGQPAAVPVDREYRAAVIDSICEAMNRAYVFADKALEVEGLLKGNLKAGEYDGIDTLAPFLERLTRDMREVTQDRHLWTDIPPEEEILIARGDLTPDNSGAQERNAFRNYGFEKVERMTENVGYLKLNGFMHTSSAAPTAIAAMNFLGNCDALIIDLRQNGGGSPTMIQLLSSYFFEEPVHLNSFYIRETDETNQFWTQAQVQGPRLADAPIFVLTSSYTFSAAEEFSYNLKNLERATLIGETTGGGAHPTDVHVFPDLRVAVSVPFGRAINPVTGTNWEGTGVSPHIAVPAEKALDVALLEALKAVGENAEPERRERIAFTVRRLNALQNPVEVPLEALRAWVGDYGPRRVFIEDGALWYQREGRPKHRMIPISKTLFCFDDIDFFTLEVETDEAGNPVALVGHYDDGRTDRSERDSG